MKTTTIKTKGKTNITLFFEIIQILFLIIGIIFMSFTIFTFIYPKPIIIDGEIINEINGELMYNMDIKNKIGFLLMIGIIFIFFPIASLLGKFTGIAKAKHKIKKDENFIKKINPYIYYRELPNEYGIGTCTLLIDSAIENEKDIIATILNLCAKKYLRLEKDTTNYKIHILKETDDKPYLTEEDIKSKLYLNEKYVLNCLKNNTIKNIDYNKWYSLCLKDGENNGLYYDKEIKMEVSKDKMKKDTKTNKIIMAITWLITIVVVANIILKKTDINKFNDIEHLLSLIIIIPTFLLGTYLLSSIFYACIMIIKGIFSTFNKSEEYYYNNKLSKKLVITEKGKIELQKLYAFENFINDFSTFASKNPEEIILWDRYLSYATMFGITKTILKSGYDKLINNSSFTIDSIDNIHINDIIIE